ncbi:MAG TPA: hypothetical protein DCY13_24520, partial [Verrucomicrobiales bacterium]|nr:hypothetical protein [Verrucomicrobiales bacterium]
MPVESGGRDRLRIVLDDRRSEPVAVTQITIHGKPRENVPTEQASVEIIERLELPGETRVVFEIGAARRHLSWLEFTVADAVFERPVRL